MKILLLAASLRKSSLNKKLTRAAHQALTGLAEPRLVEFEAYPMPVYDGDIETGPGIPNEVRKLSEAIAEADAVIISTPEYNGGMPGPFKNAVDWLSRMRPVTITGKPLLLLGASTGVNGAVRGLWHSRVPLEALGVFVYPEMFGLGQADQAFDENGSLKETRQQDRLKKVLTGFLAFAEKLSVPR